MVWQVEGFGKKGLLSSEIERARYLAGRQRQPPRPRAEPDLW